MSTIEKSIEVNVPEYTAYAQWTKFGEFPHFMEGVKEVTRLRMKSVRNHFSEIDSAFKAGQDVAFRTQGVTRLCYLTKTRLINRSNLSNPSALAAGIDCLA